MNRVNLRIYDPPADANEDVTAVDAPATLPFRPSTRTTILSGRYTPPVERARVIHENDTCPECERHDVEPLELADGLISPRNRLPIPGTSTIVGFHCNDCGTEWPVYELTTERKG